jgi:phospholipid/cholesterol/gamma-HCH transport system ATP-binding protein
MIHVRDVCKGFSIGQVLHSITFDVVKGESLVILVFENLNFTLQERTSLSPGQRKNKIKKFLEWVELSDAIWKFPDELSGGMQKRLGIARALIVEPEIILYDEPTAGLDPITSRMIADLILRLRKELGTTLVTVTSDVNRAFQLADRIEFLTKSTDNTDSYAGSDYSTANTEHVGATLKNAGTPEQTRASTDPFIQRFLRGGKLT